MPSHVLRGLEHLRQGTDRTRHLAAPARLGVPWPRESLKKQT